MNTKIIVINGTGGSGKSTFISDCAKAVEKTNTEVVELSIVDIVKDMATMVGWQSDMKTEKDRKFLSDIKCAIDNYDNNILRKEVENNITFHLYWNQKYNKKIKNIVFFINCREVKDIEYFVKSHNAKTMQIINFNVDPITSNMADAQVNDYTNYDYKIVNSGTLEDLQNLATMFMETITKEI